MKKQPSPVEWEKGELWILDQRKLPAREVWIRARNVETVAKAIESLAVRGAPLIGIAAAYGVALAANEKGAARESVLNAIERLRQTRRTGHNLFHAMECMREVVQKHRGKLGEHTLVEARRIHATERARCQTMSRHGADLMEEGEQVLTYCNTGTLATGGIGTALGVIRTGFLDKKVSHVFVCETRPLTQGARLTLWELVQSGIPCTLICDNMAAALMATGEIQRIFVGADRIARNGDTANKIGTYMLALLAAYYEIPFHIVAPSTTIDTSIKDGSEMEIEERDPKELTRGIPGLAKLQGYDVWNPAFDITPAGLIHSFVTEYGIEEPPFQDD
ncbi:S-methyl-5-thioribose-1-phosphate isomerase [bacterium]|nr:S-methyl-5-thioribose-1-phosphate isomerase [bacterium]MBU1937223.1 S-methyl-5-thioribose-1-phosphate isomerase [bacterium]